MVNTNVKVGFYDFQGVSDQPANSPFSEQLLLLQQI